MAYKNVPDKDNVIIHVQPKHQAKNEAGEEVIKPEAFEPTLDPKNPVSKVKKLSVNHVDSDPDSLSQNISEAKLLISGCRTVRKSHKFALGNVALIRKSGKAFNKSVLVVHSPIDEIGCTNPKHCDVIGISHDFGHWHALAYLFRYA